VTDHIQGSVKLDLTRNQSITTLYRYDNVTFCNVQFCNNVPFCHLYRFVTVLLSNVPFLAMYSFVMILHFKMYRFVTYSCETYHFGMNLFAMYISFCNIPLCLSSVTQQCQGHPSAMAQQCQGHPSAP
jgi:hypothetical protein